MLPHELHESFPDAAARAGALQQLVDLCRRLEELERLAALPVDQWAPEQLQELSAQLVGDPRQAAKRLARWRALFADELRQARGARDAAVHSRLSDVELRTAVYLAARLLRSAYGRGHEG